MSADLADRVVGQLQGVLDPCSCMTDRPMSIVELGLLEGIEVDDRSVAVELVPTSPMCLYMTDIIAEAEAEILELDGVDDVQVTQNLTELWRPERMDEAVRRPETALQG